MTNLDCELVSGGFVSDRKVVPLNFAGMKKQRKYAKRTEKRTPSQTAAAQYKRAQRAKWIAMGLDNVRPRTPEEYALREAANRMGQLPMLRQVGSGPLAMWVAEQAAA